jgi:hypothetical protein
MPLGTAQVGVKDLRKLGRVRAARAVSAPDQPVGAQLGHRIVELTGVRIRAAEFDEDVGSRSDRTHAQLPVATGVATDEWHVGNRSASSATSIGVDSPARFPPPGRRGSPPTIIQV